MDDEGDESLFERATASEICGYYDHVLHQRFLPSGRIRFFGNVDHLGEGLIRSRVTGIETTIHFKKLVDATYLEGRIPATSPAPFEVSADAHCIPVGDLTNIESSPEAFVVIGAGKTGQDACLWLLASGVSPDAIRWIRPRDPWLQTRRSAQPGAGVPESIEIFSHSVEAAAKAKSISDLFERLESANVLCRIDPAVQPTTYQGAIISDWQVDQLRCIRNVIRLGHVVRIEREQIVLKDGVIPTTPKTLHIHCAVPGLSAPKTKPVFDGTRITPQNLRYGLLPLSVAISAFVEATRTDDTSKNALCRPLQFSGAAEDWLAQRLADLENSILWKEAPDLVNWVNGTRLNITAGLHELTGDPAVQSSLKRFSDHARAAAENLRSFIGTAYLGKPDA